MRPHDGSRAVAKLSTLAGDRKSDLGEGAAGFTFSAKFRRNFGENFVSASSRKVKFRYFSSFSVLKFKKSRIFIKNSEKYDKKLGVLLSK